jgi:hypothetical protein
MRRTIAPPDPNAPNGRWEMLDWAFEEKVPACTETAVSVKRPVCRRDGVDVGDARCAATRPAEERRTGPRYDGCSIDWAVEYGQWSTTCGLATRTVSSTCMRSGGTSIPAPQPAASCSKPKPASVPTEVTTGCTYTWKVASYGEWTTKCSPSSTRSVEWRCERSDGTTALDSFCSAKTPKPSATETGPSTECGDRMADPSFESGRMGSGSYNESSPSVLWDGYGTFRNVTDAKDGRMVVEIDRNFGMIQRTGILSSGRSYIVSVWARAIGNHAHVWLIANGQKGDAYIGKTWQKVTVRVDNAPAFFRIELYTLTGGSDNSAQFDAASIELVP